MTKLSFTLAELIDSNPCLNGVSRLSKSLTEPYDGTTVVNYYDHVEHVTTADLLWELQLTQLSELDQRTICTKVAIYAARSVLHLFECEYPNDQRPRRAIEAAERCVDENFSVESLANVRRAIKLSAGMAEGAATTARMSAWAARTAALVARSDEWSAEWSAEWAARTEALAATAMRAAAEAAADPGVKPKIKNYALELIRSYDD